MSEAAQVEIATEEESREIARRESESVARVETPSTLLERAVDRGASVEVVERLMALQERWEANEARKAFDAAMADLRGELPKIDKAREVDFTSSKGRTNYRYEDLDAVVSALAPVMAKHGLSFRWRTEQEGNTVRVTCVVSHRQGHSEETSLSAAADQSGNKNSIQAVGSTVTYLQRYTLKAAVGVAAAEDTDVNVPKVEEVPDPPDGYDSWVADMEAKASDGIEALREAWKASKPEYRTHANKHDSDRFPGWKAAAEQVAS